MKNFIKIILSSLIVFTLYNCSEPEMHSSWKDMDITIDGSRKEWGEKLKYFEDEQVAIGISNDANNIYFCLATSDESKILKIMRTGFTVWLDPQDSDGKTIGIQYPIRRGRQEVGEKVLQDNKQSNKSGENIEKRIEKFRIEQNELLIVNEDNFPLNAYPLENNTGLEVKIGYELHQFVYELKVPLSNNKISTVYTDALPTETIKVGFESGEFVKPEQGDRSSMGMSDGQPSSSRGKGMRGGANRNNMGDRQEMMKQLKFSINVKLSSK